MRGSRPALWRALPSPRDGALCSCDASGSSLFRYPKNWKRREHALTSRPPMPHSMFRISTYYSLYEMCRGARTLKIGRQDQRSSAISTSNEQTIVVRGHDLARELIGVIGFTDHI